MSLWKGLMSILKGIDSFDLFSSNYKPHKLLSIKEAIQRDKEKIKQDCDKAFNIFQIKENKKNEKNL